MSDNKTKSSSGKKEGDVEVGKGSSRDLMQQPPPSMKQQQPPQQQKQQPQPQQQPQPKQPKSPSLLARNRTASVPISSTNPNVTSHPLHATNLSLSSPSSSSKSSPKSSFRPHFQAATTTSPSSPSALRSVPAVTSSPGATAGIASVPPLVGSVPKTPPRRRSKLNAHRQTIDMHLVIPSQDVSSATAADRHNISAMDTPFSPGLLGDLNFLRFREYKR